MKGFLNTVRWIFAVLTGFILFVFVLITPIVSSVTSNVTHRENLKEWISESEIYENADDLVIVGLNEKIEQSVEAEGGDVEKVDSALSEHDTEQIITDILTPEFTKDLVEGAIDGIYDFLEGKSDTVVVDIDRKQIEDAVLKVLLASSSSDLKIDSIEELKGLPVCTKEQAIEFELEGGFDSIDEACLPEKVDFNEITQEAITGLGLDDSSNTEEALAFSSQEIDFSSDERLAIRTGFRIVQFLPAILILTIFTLSLLTVIITPGFRTGLIFTSLMGAVPAVISLIMGLVLLFGSLATQITLSLIDIPEVPFDPSTLQGVVDQIIRDIVITEIWYGVGIFLWFLLLAFITVFLKKKEKQTADVKTKNETA